MLLLLETTLSFYFHLNMKIYLKCFNDRIWKMWASYIQLWSWYTWFISEYAIFTKVRFHGAWGTISCNTRLREAANRWYIWLTICKKCRKIKGINEIMLPWLTKLVVAWEIHNWPFEISFILNYSLLRDWLTLKSFKDEIKCKLWYIEFCVRLSV